MTAEMINESSQYLTFSLDNEIFALDIAQVREVLELSAVTRIPRTPHFMRGVINLRGHAVPVVDMRLKFGMDHRDDTVNTCIIIVETRFGDEGSVLGALVDSVSEVIELLPDAIEPAPRMGTTIKSDFIHGIGKHDERFIIVLDVVRVFSKQELELLSAQAQTSRVESGKTTAATSTMNEAATI